MSTEQETGKAATGRPTLYRDEFCSLVVAFAKDGMSLTEIASELDVHRDSLYEWEKTHPAFSDALSRARQEAKAWWERQGRVNLATQGFNASLWGKNVSCRFPDDWTDKTKQELTGPNGTPLFSRVEIVAVEPGRE